MTAKRETIICHCHIVDLMTLGEIFTLPGQSFRMWEGFFQAA